MIDWFEVNEMKVNRDKFQFILFGKDKIETTLTIDDHDLQNQDAVKLLGVHMDRHLNFDIHISEICRKAGRKLNVLGRLSKSLDIESKKVLFHNFILSPFEYCPAVWHFSSRENMKTIEKFQKQALQFIHNDYDYGYSDLKAKSGRPLLYVQRLRSMLSLLAKCTDKKAPKYLSDMFPINENSRCLRKPNQLKISKFNTVKYGRNSISYERCKLWNDLDEQAKASKFENWYPSCSCSYCDLCTLQRC